MKKALKIVIVLVVALVMLALAAPFFIPMETYKAEILAHAKEATGRDIAIGGDMALRIFPTAGITLDKVTVSNAPGFGKEPFATIETLVLDVETLPLLSGKIRVTSLVLKRPSIHLAVDGKRNNWQLALPEPQPKKQTSLLIAPAYAEASSVNSLSLSDVRIEDGMLTYRNLSEKTVQTLEQLDLQASLKEFVGELKLKADALFNREKAALTLTIASFEAFVNERESNVALTLTSALAEVDFNGKGSAKALDGTAKISTKGNTLAGNLGVKLGEGAPLITGKLKADTLDLNAFLPQKQASLGLVSSAQAAAPWTNAPLDFSGLRGANANLTIDIGKLLVQKLTMTEMQLLAKLSGGKLVADVPQMKLYGGSGSANIVLDGSGSTPSVHKKLNVSGVNAEAFLKDAMDFDRLSGTAQINVSVSGNGKTQQQIVSSLSGNGSVQFADGAIKGINLAEMVRNVKSAFTETGGSQKTDFAELGGTFTIAQGIVTNKDLAMKAPLLRVKGEGSVNLPAWTVNYRVTPEVVGTLKGQGGKEKEGLAVPIIVEGSLDHPSWRPDFESTLKEALKDPAKAKEQIKNVRGEVKGSLKELQGMFKKKE